MVLPVARRSGIRQKLRPLLLVVAPVAAIALHIKVPLFSDYFSFLDPPVLITVYFALLLRDAVQALFIGCAIGLAQDALSSNPIGQFGMVKTLVGYIAASAGQRLNVDSMITRSGFAFVFYLFHQVLYAALGAGLLGQQFALDPPETLLFAVMNAAVAAPLFQLLDRL